MIHSLFTQTLRTTPPLTRAMSLILIILALLVHINVISPLSLTYSSYYVRKLQLWRLITSFFYFGPFSVDVLLHVVFFFRYSKMLEESFMNASEYAYLLMFCSVLIFVCANLFRRSLLGNMLSSAITYIWTRRNRTTQVQLLGCILFPAFFLPFVVPVFSFFSERKVPFDEVMGILVGHVYFYLRFVVKKFGYDPLRTPDWLKRVFGEEVEEPEAVPVMERLENENEGKGFVEDESLVKDGEKGKEDESLVEDGGKGKEDESLVESKDLVEDEDVEEDESLVEDNEKDKTSEEVLNKNNLSKDEKNSSYSVDHVNDANDKNVHVHTASSDATDEEQNKERTDRKTFKAESSDSDLNKEEDADFFSVSSEDNKQLEEVK